MSHSSEFVIFGVGLLSYLLYLLQQPPTVGVTSTFDGGLTATVQSCHQIRLKTGGHLTAASAVAWLSGVDVPPLLTVFSDDSTSMGVIAKHDAVPVLATTVSLDLPKRAAKYDIESAVMISLPKDVEHSRTFSALFPSERLQGNHRDDEEIILAFASGSSEDRDYVAVVSYANVLRTVHIRASSLYEAFRRQFTGSELNIEGVVVSHPHDHHLCTMRFLQRGNGALGAVSAAVETDCASLMDYLAAVGDGDDSFPPPTLSAAVVVDLGSESGVPYAFTDGVSIADGDCHEPYAQPALFGSHQHSHEHQSHQEHRRAAEPARNSEGEDVAEDLVVAGDHGHVVDTEDSMEGGRGEALNIHHGHSKLLEPPCGGKVLFVAVAENTPDVLHDGPVMGTIMGVIDFISHGTPTVRHVQLRHADGSPFMDKVEGVELQCPGGCAAGNSEVLIVTDPDSEAQPSLICTVTLGGDWYR